MNRYFKHILSVWLICFGFIMARAQQNHFIYLQTENKRSMKINLARSMQSLCLFFVVLAHDAGLDPLFAEKFLNFIIAEVIRHHEAIAGAANPPA